MCRLGLDSLEKADRLGSTVMTYRVCYGRGYVFDNLSDAKTFADIIFRKTGIVVGIVNNK